MTILYFAQARRITGLPQETIAVTGPLSTYDLWDMLINRHPELATLRGSSRLARNDEFIPSDATLSPDDEIAIIPPVSGG